MNILVVLFLIDVKGAATVYCKWPPKATFFSEDIRRTDSAVLNDMPQITLTEKW